MNSSGSKWQQELTGSLPKGIQVNSATSPSGYYKYQAAQNFVAKRGPGPQPRNFHWSRGPACPAPDSWVWPSGNIFKRLLINISFGLDSQRLFCRLGVQVLSQRNEGGPGGDRERERERTELGEREWREREWYPWTRTQTRSPKGNKDPLLLLLLLLLSLSQLFSCCLLCASLFTAFGSELGKKFRVLIGKWVIL